MKKTHIIFLVLGFAGAGLYFGGAHVLDQFAFLGLEPRVTKKISAVKPKNFYSDRRAYKGRSFYENENFSFFSVLNDTSLNAMVDLNGKVVTPRRSSPARISPARVSRTKSIPVPLIHVEKDNSYKAVPTITPFRPKRNPPKRREPAELKTVESKKVVDRALPVLRPYVLQVSSFRKLERAEALKTTLASKGYASFIGKTELPDNKGTWHRVYVGKYQDRAGAEREAGKILREEKLRAMVIRKSG